MFEVLERMTFTKGQSIGFIILGCVIAPYWYTFHYVKEISALPDIWSRLILCIAISAPICLIRFGILIYTEAPLDKDKSLDPDIETETDFIFIILGKASLLVAVSFYVVVFMGMFIDITERGALIRSTTAVFIGDMGVDILRKWRKNKKAKSKEKSDE